MQTRCKLIKQLVGCRRLVNVSADAGHHDGFHLLLTARIGIDLILKMIFDPNTSKIVHNTFFLFLYEMGIDNKAVQRIMGITHEAIRIPVDALTRRLSQDTGFCRMGGSKDIRLLSIIGFNYMLFYAIYWFNPSPYTIPLPFTGERDVSFRRYGVRCFISIFLIPIWH